MQITPETGSLVDWITDSSRTPATLYNRRKVLKLFERANGKRSIADILDSVKTDKENVYSLCKIFLDYIRKDRSSMTVYVYRSMISGFWVLVLGENNFHRSAFNRLCPTPKAYASQLKKSPSVEKVREMLRMATPKYRALIGVLAISGMRIGETLSRKISDIEIRQQGYARITLRAKETKAKESRFAFLTRECVSWISSYRTSLDHPSEYLFQGFQGKPLHYMSAMSAIKDLYRKVGCLDTPDKSEIYSIHGLRTFADSQIGRTGIDRKWTELIIGHKSALAASQAYKNWEVIEQDWLRLCEQKLRTNKPMYEFSRAGQSMGGKADLERKEMIRGLRNLLPYLKDWAAWQRELARLERNVVKLRKHRYARLARTLEGSLSILRMVLDEEKKEHAFTVNQLIRKLESKDRLAR